MNKKLYGKRLLESECESVDWMDSKIEKTPAVTLGRLTVHCSRCGSYSWKKSLQLPNGAYYCPKCLEMGRASSDEWLYSIAEPNLFSSEKIKLVWKNELGIVQKSVSEELKKVCEAKTDHLLYAVTGSGKTEMMVEAIYQALCRHERVAVASPRVDVCLELFPRFQEFFPDLKMALLYGNSKNKIDYAQLTICTTHQLLRFYHAFDVLVIDEVDAFPFAENPQLAFAVECARKKKSACLYLTATPSPRLFKEVRQGKLGISYVPRRYHGHDLSVPQQVVLKTGEEWLVWVQTNLESKRRLLIFVPQIVQLQSYREKLLSIFPALLIETVYAADPKRQEKVAAMRNQDYQILLSTTILERGVTFENIDVFVLNADYPQFSTAALIQMAGRVGRSKYFPEGDVVFFYRQKTRAILHAVRQIKQMNRSPVQEER